jgi:thiamine biosynthesis lipoprotein
MGMPITVEVILADGEEANRNIDRAFDYFREVDRTFSTYKPDSEISRINRRELAPEDAPEVVLDVLAQCETMKRRTGGYFDIVRDGQMDPSGLVKGWSIGEAAKLLDEAGMRNYCITAGGDIQLRGRNAEGELWRVGIKHPARPQEIVKVLRLTDMAVATSGTYERGEHIYDPQSGRAATHWVGLTVVGPGICEVDVFATAAFAMGASGPAWLAEQGYECYAIGQDGVAVFTAGLANYL